LLIVTIITPLGENDKIIMTLRARSVKLMPKIETINNSTQAIAGVIRNFMGKTGE
jgi:hypothetical protein